MHNRHITIQTTERSVIIMGDIFTHIRRKGILFSATRSFSQSRLLNQCSEFGFPVKDILYFVLFLLVFCCNSCHVSVGTLPPPPRGNTVARCFPLPPLIVLPLTHHTSPTALHQFRTHLSTFPPTITPQSPTLFASTLPPGKATLVGTFRKLVNSSRVPIYKT